MLLFCDYQQIDSKLKDKLGISYYRFCLYAFTSLRKTKKNESETIKGKRKRKTREKTKEKKCCKGEEVIVNVGCNFFALREGEV